MDEEDYRLKGPAFLTLVRYIKERRGQKGVDHVFSILKKEMPELYIPSKEFKTKKMYPDMLFIRLLEILDREFGKGDLRECYNFGRYSSYNLGVMGIFVSFLGTPSTVLKKAPKSWRYYRNRGELVVTKLEPGLGVLELRGYLKSKTICTELLGFFNGAAEQTKAKNVKVRETKCKSKGDPVCEFMITWEE